MMSNNVLVKCALFTICSGFVSFYARGTKPMQFSLKLDTRCQNVWAATAALNNENREECLHFFEECYFLNNIKTRH